MSVGWSGYVSAFLKHVGAPLPKSIISAPIEWDSHTREMVASGAVLNIPAIFITLFATILLIFGIRESARVNSVIVAIKIAIILLFIFACVGHVNPKNWDPFFPPNEGSFSRYGVTGMLTASTTVFFAYIGFDAVSTTAQEAKNPQRDLPISILGSLAICIVLYIAVSLVLTGTLNYKYLSGDHPLS